MNKEILERLRDGTDGKAVCSGLLSSNPSDCKSVNELRRAIRDICSEGKTISFYKDENWSHKFAYKITKEDENHEINHSTL